MGINRQIVKLSDCTGSNISSSCNRNASGPNTDTWRKTYEVLLIESNGRVLNAPLREVDLWLVGSASEPFLQWFSRRTTSGQLAGVSPLPFFENRKKVPLFCKKSDLILEKSPFLLYVIHEMSIKVYTSPAPKNSLLCACLNLVILPPFVKNWEKAA